MASFTRDDYRVGIICALDGELAAVEGMLDEEHERLLTNASDSNTYSFGRIHGHNVVAACLPAGRDGLSAAALVAKDMLRSFGQLRFGLLVGIGGGIPDLARNRDIRLGDVVVSQPSGIYGGVVQYDKGKMLVSYAEGEGDSETRWERKGSLNSPPTALLAALSQLKARHRRFDSTIPLYLAKMAETYPKMVTSGYKFQGTDQDVLFQHAYKHPVGKVDCQDCSPSYHVRRPFRLDNNPIIHYGTIASGNAVVKNPADREYLRKDCDALCVEMEAAALMNDFPCLVIRGICDYADSHKNDDWHDYAAATAAAFAKELLEYVSSERTEREKPIQQVVGKIDRILEDLEELRRSTTHQSVRISQKPQPQYQKPQHRTCHQLFDILQYEQQKNRNELRESGTCRWVLDHLKYRQWQTSKRDLLFVSGRAGCGKSVLARSLVDQDLKRPNSQERINICYFFFKDTTPFNSLSAALCSILHQLFDQQPKLIAHAVPIWERRRKKLVVEKQELWRILLHSTSDRSAYPTVCVLDALDECKEDDQAMLAKMLLSLSRSAETKSLTTKLKFLITTKPDCKIEGGRSSPMRALSTKFIHECDHISEVEAEINIVMHLRVRKLVKDLELQETTRKRIESKLERVTGRTFLWLHLVMAEIHQAFSEGLRPDEVSLDQLPLTEVAIYEQILKRLADAALENVRKVLLIILGAWRALTIDDVATALEISISDQRPRSLADLKISPSRLKDRIHQWCGLLIKFDDVRLEIIHSTARRFLTYDVEAEKTNSVGLLRFLPYDIEAEMARIFIHYLQLSDFDDDYIESFREELSDERPRSISSRRSSFASQRPRLQRAQRQFFKLAAESWVHLWRKIEPRAREELTNEVRLLYDRLGGHFEGWAQAMWHSQMGTAYPYPDEIQLAAFNGHCQILIQLLNETTPDLDSVDSQGYTALMRAAEMGHGKAVQILIDHGADPDSLGSDDVLTLAGSGISFLDNNDNDDGYYGEKLIRFAREPQRINPRSALYYAAANGHGEVVKVLLAADADADSEGEGALALYAASEEGHEEIVQILLSKGISADALELDHEDNGNALFVASANGRERVVRLLLDAKATVNSTNGRKGTALQAAAAGGYESVVKILINAHANIEADQGDNGSALQEASYQGHSAVVHILLKAGAKLNRPGKYGTALRAACLGGHEPVVQLLLDANADVNADVYPFGVALKAAASQGHDGLVKLLLKAGADVEDSGALETAKRAGHQRVVIRLQAQSVASQAPKFAGRRTVVYIDDQGSLDQESADREFTERRRMVHTDRRHRS